MRPPAPMSARSGRGSRTGATPPARSRHRHQVASPEAADIVLDAALLVSALFAWDAEERVEPVVRAERDEPVGLDPITALQDAGHRGLQVVVPDPSGDAAEVGERLDMPLQERFLGLGAVGDVERASGSETTASRTSRPSPACRRSRSRTRRSRPRPPRPVRGPAARRPHGRPGRAQPCARRRTGTPSPPRPWLGVRRPVVATLAGRCVAAYEGRPGRRRASRR